MVTAVIPLLLCCFKKYYDFVMIEKLVETFNTELNIGFRE